MPFYKIDFGLDLHEVFHDSLYPLSIPFKHTMRSQAGDKYRLENFCYDKRQELSKIGHPESKITLDFETNIRRLGSIQIVFENS